MIDRFKSNRILGIGSALVDILINESDAFLNEIGALKGGMTLTSDSHINEILLKTRNKSNIVPGGSACNTIIGIALLGGQTQFIGKRGEDDLGKFFENYLKKNYVDTCLLTSTLPTGKVLSIITPDAQRTMYTYLGAASETRPDEIFKSYFKNLGIAYIEGYLIYNKDLIFKILKLAKAAGVYIALDLSSYTIVEENKSLFKSIVEEYVDILFANEDEARVFTENSDEQTQLDLLSRNVDIAILKLGKRGSMVYHNDQTIKIDPKGTKDAIDTTGAGDLYAAGFLFGLVNGYSILKCGEIASLCGYEVCQEIGASISNKGWERINYEL